MKNAFNSAWVPMITNRLQETGNPNNIAQLCNSFLKQRRIKTEDITTETKRGCPQGSSLGPIMWILLMDNWFQNLDDSNALEENDTVQAFADDQIIILSGTSLKTIEDKWNAIWHTCETWANRNKLEYNEQKTETIFIPYKPTREPRLRIRGKQITFKQHLLYLGVTVDTGLFYIEHVKKNRQKHSTFRTNYAT